MLIERLPGIGKTMKPSNKEGEFSFSALIGGKILLEERQSNRFILERMHQNSTHA